jgi:hypothetical protein
MPWLKEDLPMAHHRSLFLACSLFCLPSFCQIGSGGAGGFVSISSPANDRVGVPYSAEFVTTRVQTLADGTQITIHQGKQVDARDSAGRTRDEMYMHEPPPGSRRNSDHSDQPVFVTIMDPVAGQFIHLDTRNKTATVTPFPTINAKQSAPKSPQTAPVQSLPQLEMPHSSVEKLGAESIGGVYAEGKRITRIIPAGTEGNDRDFSVITETWESSELGIDVLRKTTDPRSGVTTREAKNLTRAEPDPALFQIPADYKLQAPQTTIHP